MARLASLRRRRNGSISQIPVYYDTVVGSEAALRFLIDQVGVERVVLGSDWPFVPWHPSPVTWLQGLEALTEDEKESSGAIFEALLKL